jgi:hypothetical protein
LVIAYVHRHLGIPVVLMSTGTDNERAIGLIESTGAIAVRDGPRQLPDGSTVDARWFEHRDPSPSP